MMWNTKPVKKSEMSSSILKREEKYFYVFSSIQKTVIYPLRSKNIKEKKTKKKWNSRKKAGEKSQLKPWNKIALFYHVYPFVLPFIQIHSGNRRDSTTHTILICQFFTQSIFRPSCAHWNLGWMLWIILEHQPMDHTITSTIISIITTSTTPIKQNRCRNFRMRLAPCWSFVIWLSKPFLISNTRCHRQAQIVQLPVCSHPR